MESTIMDTKIIDQLEAVFGEEFKLVQHNLDKMEQLAQQKMQLLGQGFLQRLVDQAPNGYQGSCVPCQCGGSMEFVGHRTSAISSASWSFRASGFRLGPSWKATWMGTALSISGISAYLQALGLSAAHKHNRQHLSRYESQQFSTFQEWLLELSVNRSE